MEQKKILLESHNLKNLTSGFGIFNSDLITALKNLEINDFDIYLNNGNIAKLKKNMEINLSINSTLVLKGILYFIQEKNSICGIH